MLVPPVNFALVVGQVYRSGHPTELNQPFLDSLSLKTIVYIGDAAPEYVTKDYENWVASRGIKLVNLHMASVKEPFCTTNPDLVQQAVELALDECNHPILIHSDKGKHRVGVVVAVIRKSLQMWALAPIYGEYIRFAKGKANSDFLFIEQFEFAPPKVPPEHFPKWVHTPELGR